MNKNRQRFIRRVNSVCGIVGGGVFITYIAIVMLKIIGWISYSVLLVGVMFITLCWWLVYSIKFFAERKLINELKDWAQHVVDTNYYQGQRITVKWRNGVWFSGPEDVWFRKKFIAHCREMCSDTGMKIYYNYGWIRM